MNKSDKIITAAALAGIDIKISEKETHTIKENTTVLLYDKPCLEINRYAMQLTIYKDTLCSRKSTRLMNSIIEQLTEQRVESHNGVWYIKNKNKVKRSKIEKNMRIPITKAKILNPS